MKLLRLWSLPWLRRHPLRYLLLLAGVALGVATPVAIYGGARAVWGDVAGTLQTLAGRADLVVTAGDGGVPEDLLEPIQALPGVAAAAPVIEVLTELDDGARLLILALDLTGDGALRPWLGGEGRARPGRRLRLDPLTFIAQPDSVLAAATLARQRGWTLGKRFAMKTAMGTRTLTVRGLLDDPAIERVHGGNLAIMDVYGAQLAFARGRSFDRIEVALQTGADAAAVRGSLQRLAGPGRQVEPPLARGAPLLALLETYGALQLLASVLAALLGIAMIDAAFRLAVTQRRVEIGILRALGATRGQVQRLFLAEGLLTGLLGAALGLALGVAAYNALARSFGGGYRNVLGGLAQQVYRLEATPGLTALAFAAGLGISLAASWWPAREAAQVSPVETLRRHPRGLPALAVRIPGWLPPVLLAIALAVTLASGPPGLVYAAMLAAVLAGLALLPAAVGLVLRAARAPVRRLLGLDAVLALDALARSPRRTVSTVAVLGLVFAVGVVVGGIKGGTRQALERWIADSFAADLLISTSANLVLQPYRFPAGFAEEVAAVPGIARVEAVRARRMPVAGLPRLVVAADGGGDEIRVSEPLARLREITLDTPRGPLHLKVSGVVADFGDRAGVLFLPRPLYRAWWGDDTFDKLRVHLEPGLPAAAARERIRASLRARFPAAILTRDEVRASVLEPPGRRLSPVEIQLILVTLAAALALANFALVSVAERAPEFALARVLGAFRAQVRRRLWLEVVATGLLAWGAGLVAGAVLLAYLLRAVEVHLALVRLPFVFPWLPAAGLLLAAAAAGVVAVLAAGPALDRIALARSLDAE